MFDNVHYQDGKLGNMRTPNQDGPPIGQGKDLSGPALHDLSMMYVEKTSYEGILPEQLAKEYFVAQSRIQEMLHLDNEKKRAATDGHAHGFKLEDQIR